MKHTFAGHLHSFKWYIFWTIDIYPSRINTYNYSLTMRNTFIRMSNL